MEPQSKELIALVDSLVALLILWPLKASHKLMRRCGIPRPRFHWADPPDRVWFIRKSIERLDLRDEDDQRRLQKLIALALRVARDNINPDRFLVTSPPLTAPRRPGRPRPTKKRSSRLSLVTKGQKPRRATTSG